MTDTINLDRFDALVQAQEEGIEFELHDEVGAPIGLKLRMVGPDSKRARQAMKAVAAEFAARAEEKASLQTAEDEEEERMIAFLSKVVTHWSPNPAIGGKEVPFSEENARTFFSRFRLFTEQVQARAVRRAPFARSSSSDSASSSPIKPPASRSKSRQPGSKSGGGSAS
jgi:hypothetical protein